MKKIVSFKGKEGIFGSISSIKADNNPSSPNYGSVYMAYHFNRNDVLAFTKISLLASRDFGETWTEIDVNTSRQGSAINFRLTPDIEIGKNGEVYLTFALFDNQFPANDLSTERTFRVVQQYDYVGDSLTLKRNPLLIENEPFVNSLPTERLITVPGTGYYYEWYIGVYVSPMATHPQTGKLYQVMAQYDPDADASGLGKGYIRLCKFPSDLSSVNENTLDCDTSLTRRIPNPTDIGLCKLSTGTPTIAINKNGTILVSYQAFPDVGSGNCPIEQAYMQSYYTYSTDGGVNFSTPKLISNATWYSADITIPFFPNQESYYQRRAIALPDGSFYMVNVDGRNAEASPSLNYGNADIFGVRFEE